jgi:carboxymethylenebutenolidase
VLDKNLDQAGIEHEIKIYPGAPHSFFDRRQADFADASADAWQRILSFIHAHSSS